MNSDNKRPADADVRAMNVGSTVVAGIGVAGAAAGVAVGVEMISQIEAARDQAVDSLHQQYLSLSDEGVARIGSAFDEHSARLESIAADIGARYASSLEQHSVELEQRVGQNIHAVARQINDEINSLIHDGERELHRLAQQFEAELIQKRDEAVADIRDAGQRAVEMAQGQVESIRDEAHRIASAASAEVDGRIQNLESTVTDAIGSIHQVADARSADLENFQGSFRIDHGQNPEDDYHIG